MKVLRLLVPASLATTLALLVACSQQGEGERCDTRAGNRGNDDCQSGLVCTGRENLNGATFIDTSSSEGRCCPVDRSTATETICKQGNGGIGSDTGAPDAVGPAPDAGSDATSDAPVEAETPDTGSIVDASDAG